MQSIIRRRFSIFTLIELLVVIAVIAILTSLALPALKKARDTTKKIACMANMKQMAIATGMYSSDYEYLPGEGQETANLATLKWWNRTDASYAAAYQIAPYLNCFGKWPLPDNCILHCPADAEKQWDPGTSTGDNYGKASYLFNRETIADGTSGAPGAAKKISSFSKPSGTVIFYDQLVWYCHHGTPSNDCGLTGLMMNAKAGGNYLFLDGHSNYYFGLTPADTDWMASTECW